MYIITHRIHGAGIYANIGGILMVNVTIYSSTMDPMGYWVVIKRYQQTFVGGSTWLHMDPPPANPISPSSKSTRVSLETCGKHHQKLQWKHFLKPEIHWNTNY